MPYHPSMSKVSMASGLLPIEVMPQGAEFWKIMPLYFPEPDTFPLSYLAKIIGCNPILVNRVIQKKDEDIKLGTLKSEECINDKWAQIPTSGAFSGHLRRLRHVSSEDHNEALDEVDPMWTAILDQYQGFKDDLYKPSTEISEENVISDDHYVSIQIESTSF
jgi:hypothetical protein